MTDIHAKKDGTHSVNPIVAGIAGAVVGGAAVAAAVVMSDKKNQKKVGDAVDAAKEKISAIAETIKSQPIVEKGTKKVEEIATEVKKKLEA